MAKTRKKSDSADPRNPGEQPSETSISSAGSPAPPAPPVVGSNGTFGPNDGGGRIIDQQIDRELHDSYLVYAMSTIMDRALPDVRDGMKPSQRRILVAMNDLNLSPGRKHIKCAKIAGDTSGNYHPHGEGVIYPTLVNMGQDWKMRALLIDKQGNFGSIDGDPPAAMRYTEARLTHASVAMLQDLKLDTVDYQPNYDDRLLEPTVLPGKFPNLLINGSSGIAVGMASSIPPHNPTEIFNAIISVIDNPELSLEQLLEIVPGPDFPTGGVIHGRRGIHEAYATGRGRISVRGRISHETDGKRESLIIDEIPYQLVQNNLIEKIVEAAKDDRITDISDVKNFSGKSHRTRIVVYLKKGADPAVVEKQLYQYTPLESTVSIINIALVHRRPRTLSLRQLIDCYIEHRVNVIRRRTEYLLREAKKHAHRLEGLIFAVCDIEEVIALIRNSKTREEAIDRLIARRFRIAPDHRYAQFVPQSLINSSNNTAGGNERGILLTRIQAEAIGALRLIQLVGLEIEKLASEYAGVLADIAKYESILADNKLVLSMIRDDCVEMREKFGTPRLTTIEEADDSEGDFDIGALIAEHEVVVTLSHQGYIKRLPSDTYRQQGRGGVGVKGSETRDEDYTQSIFVASSHDDLLCFTNTGRVFRMKVYRIPEMSRTAKGRAIVNLLELREGERIVASLNIPKLDSCEDFLFFATAQGRVKRTSLAEFRNVHRTGIIALGLNEGDTLIDVIRSTGTDHVLLATTTGMAIRFSEDDVRPMGRTAAGVRGINLADADSVVSLIRAEDDADLLTLTENGYGKRTPLNEYLVHADDGSVRPQSRAGKGRIDIQTTDRNGKVVTVRAVREHNSVMFVSQSGMVVRVAARSISRIGRNTQGVRLVKLKEGDKLIAAAVAETEGDESELPDSSEPLDSAQSPAASSNA